MFSRNRPRFPNRERRARRILPVALGLIALLAAGFVVSFCIRLFFHDDPVNAGLDDLTRSVAAQDREITSRRPPPAPAIQTAPTPRPRPAPPQPTPAPTPPPPPANAAPSPPAPSPAPTGTPGDANGPSLWNVPFVGHSYKDIADAMNARYAGRKPKVWADKMPGITSRITPEPEADHPVLALTLDACSGAYDAELINFLRERRIPATLFITVRWLKSNPDTFKELQKDPLFEIASHGVDHKPCSLEGREAYGIKGTASMRELVEEVEGGARELHRSGAPRPRWFRSGTAFYDDVAVAVIHDLGMNIAGYSISVDEGASLPAGRVRDKTLAAKNGDILLGHMNHPTSGTRAGLMEALPKLQEKGCVFVRLSDR